MEKKNIINELISHEISKLSGIVEALGELGFIDKNAYLSESAAWCWFEANPSIADKKKILTALGYDVSNL